MTQAQIDAVRGLREADVRGKNLTEMQIYLASYVANTLAIFCEQSEEFASAVMNKGVDLAGCLRSMKLPGRGLGYCSEFDVYRMAVQYFLDGADVEWSMRVQVPKSQSTAKTGVLELKLEDFLFGGGK